MIKKAKQSVNVLVFRFFYSILNNLLQKGLFKTFKST